MTQTHIYVTKKPGIKNAYIRFKNVYDAYTENTQRRKKTHELTLSKEGNAVYVEITR